MDSYIVEPHSANASASSLKGPAAKQNIAMTESVKERSMGSVPIRYNNFIPLPGFAAMMLFGRIYARRSRGVLDEGTVRHELIHAAQAVDCGSWMKYYWKYAVYSLRFGYSRNPFEREACRYMYVKGYLDFRRDRTWENYLP